MTTLFRLPINNNALRYTLAIFFGWLLVCSNITQATDDTSIYFNPRAKDKPNIMFILDSSTSMNTGLAITAEPYVHTKTYDQQTANGTRFKRDTLYLKAGDQFYPFDAGLNTCDSLTKENGTIDAGFVGLLGYDEAEGLPDEGWKPLLDDKTYTAQVVTTESVASDCQFIKIADDEPKLTAGTHQDPDKRWRIKYNNEIGTDPATGNKLYYGDDTWVIFEVNAPFYLQRDQPRGHTRYEQCNSTDIITKTSYKIVQGDWRAIECSADNGVHGQTSSSGLLHPKPTAGPDIDARVDQPAVDDADLNDWWQSSSSAPEYIGESLSYGNYWNWWYGPGNYGEGSQSTTRWKAVVRAFKNIVDKETGKNIGLASFIRGGRGAEIKYPISDIDIGDNKAKLKSATEDIDRSGWHATTPGYAVEEVSRYFSGTVPNWTLDQGWWIESHPDTKTADGSLYISPITSACQKNHIIVLTDGEPSGDWGDYYEPRLQSYWNDHGFYAKCDDYKYYRHTVYTCLPIIAKFAYEADISKKFEGKQNIHVHTIAFNGSNAKAQTLLKLSAANGGGQYFSANNIFELGKVFNDIFEEVNTTAGTPAAPSVPVSATSRFSVGNRVYISLFKPDLAKGWHGNLKSYYLKERKVSYLSTATDDQGQTSTVSKTKTVVELVDENNIAVLDPSTQIPKTSALSRWSGDTADGDDVTLGGARHQLDATARVFLNTSEANTVLIDKLSDFDQVDNYNLGVANDAQKQTLLKWAFNHADGAKSGEGFSKFIGDPLHSSPRGLAYKDGDSRKELVFFGTNLGFLHAVDTQNGEEAFRWMPKELLRNIKTYYDGGEGNKLYGLDGNISIWHKDQNNNRLVDGTETAMLYIGMRRGGRNYYAIDISDYENPKLAWAIYGGSPGFEDLGQTWSKMLVRTMKYKGARRDILVFSGGYDPGHDNQEPGKFNYQDNLGRGIYIVDALTGAKLWSAGASDFSHNYTREDMQASTPASPITMDVTGSGLVDMIFSLDVAGNLMRYDIVNTPALNNAEASINNFIRQPRRIAALQENSADSNTVSKMRREFFSQPVAAVIDNGNKYRLTISFGSGRRTAPRSEVVLNRFYTIRQSAIFTDISKDFDYTHDDLAQVKINELSTDLTSTTIVNADSEDVIKALDKQGFYMDLADTDAADSGEKVLGKAVIIAGTAVFATYIPEKSSTSSSAECNAPGLGKNRLYVLNITTGETVQTFELKQPGIFGDTDVVQYNGKTYVNAPYQGPGGTTTLIDTDHTPNCTKGGLCLPPGGSAFYKFWIERSF